uniref:lipocalin family protein n=1 Tax=Gelidibacter sp. TaxID=2018083 RepID=UPI00404AF116
MKIFKILPFIALAILTLFNSCSKDDDSSSEPNVEDLLLSGKWYFESRTNLILDICDKQSNWRFLPNGNYILEYYHNADDGCEIYDSTEGIFELLSNETFSVTYEENTLVYDIVAISETELIVTATSGGMLITIVLDKNPGNG